MGCWISHKWGPWSLVRAWEYTLEEYRFCSGCGKMERGDSWRVADRESLIKLQTGTITSPTKAEFPWGKEGVELFAGARQ